MELPAYDIVVDPALLHALGEIVVIFGQIDDDMTRSITGILGIDRDTANRLMRNTEAVDLWSGILTGRNAHPDFAFALKLAASEVKGIHRDRNDFIHADYSPAFPFQGGWVTVRGSGATGAEWDGGKVLAARSRDQKQRDTSEIAKLRDRAARTSRLVAHVTYAVAPHGSWEHSPWYAGIEPFMAKAAGRTPNPTPQPTRVVSFDGVRPTPSAPGR